MVICTLRSSLRSLPHLGEHQRRLRDPHLRVQSSDRAVMMCTCDGIRLGSMLRQDIDRYRFMVQRENPRIALLVMPKLLLLFPGLWVLIAYRFSHFFLVTMRPRLLGILFAVPAFLTQRFLSALWSIEIDARAHIGPGLLICHSSGIVIGPVRIGSFCNIGQGVTLGRSTYEKDPTRPDVPMIGHRVWIGPGAVVAGGVKVEDDASIGANSVVTTNVPTAGVMVGVPATLVSSRGSFAQVAYRSMEQDNERVAALARSEGKIAHSAQDGNQEKARL